MLKLLLIFVGSGAGGVLRYGVGSAVQAWWGATFPMGTLLVNITGCLVMGFLTGMWAEADGGGVRPEVRAALLIGVLGGYTTFSSFGHETLTLMQAGHAGRAGAYVLLSVGAGLGAAWVGWMLGQRV